jgi:16S rRNA (adenine1518-N6/adenine1519-N6)-dimethyltransferase
LKFNLREYAMNILQASGEHRKLKVAGNIPYYITSDILFKLFEHADIIDRAVIMMQKEVAERICAQPRTKAYGILSIAARFVSAPNIALKVPSGCFTPRPSVDSAVVVFDFSKASITMKQFAMVHPIVRTAFGQRRKMLSNALHTYINAYGKELPEDIQSMMQKRAEELLPEHFLRLAECFTQS